MRDLLGDIRYALRSFRQTPGFTLTAVLTLAIGLGGTTGIFSLIHAVMLRSLPVADPARLYRIGDGNECCVEGGPQDRWGMYSYPLFERLKAAAPEFEQVTAFQAGSWEYTVRRVGVDRFPRPLHGEFVTGNYFSTLGIQPFAGRLLSESDDRASAAPVAVLSYRAWQGTYGADPGVVGSSYMIQGSPFTVIGIAPPGFFGETLRSDPPDLWMPLHQEPLIRGEGSILRQSVSAWLRAVGRLRPGSTVEGMSPRLTATLRQWIRTDSGYPSNWMPEILKMVPRQIVNVVPAGGGVAVMKEDYGRSLQILLSVCGLVMLIACANLANLLLARGMARRSQTSVRLAIGASRTRIVRQSLTEGILLALAGGAAGLFVADGAGRLILRLAFHSARFLPIDTTPSWPAIVFAFALSLVTGALFSAAPAWFATRTDPVESLRGGGRGITDRSAVTRKALLVFQAALSVLLVAGAGMLTRSLRNLEHQNFGFQTKGRIAVRLNALPANYTPERLDAVYRNVAFRLNHLPGVERASLAGYNPLTDNWGELVFVDGHPVAAIAENMNSSWDRVGPGFFEAAGQRILRGREFTEADNAKTPSVAVVNQTFVRRFLPSEDPIGKHFGLDMPQYARTYEIVGVVEDAKYIEPEKPARPMFFAALAQWAGYDNELMRKLELNTHFIGAAMLLTRSDPGAIEPVLRKTLAEVDPNLTVINVRSMEDLVAMNFDQQRTVAGLAGLFGIVALILAAVALYGITMYTVAQRTREIGVRMALGADESNIVKLVLRGAFQKVALGLLFGMPLAYAAGKLMSAQLYGVSAWDPASLLIAIGTLGICAFIAAVIPASRAAGIDPMRALRTE